MSRPEADPNRDTQDDPLDWRSVLRGSLVGLAVIVPVTVIRVIADRESTNFSDSGWVYPLFVLILVGFFAAGWVAGRARPTVPLTYGALAGAGTLVCWIPIRIAIWAVREDGRALFSGTKAALPPGQVFGDLIIASALGMLGAWIGARRALRRPDRY